MELGDCNYIGRTAGRRVSRVWGGPVHRLREHMVALYKHRQGTVSRSQVRSRYHYMISHGSKGYPTMVLLMSVPSHLASAYEATLIGLAAPNCNNISHTFGVKLPCDQMRASLRCGARRSRATTRHRLAAQLMNDADIELRAGTVDLLPHSVA